MIFKQRGLLTVLITLVSMVATGQQSLLLNLEKAKSLAQKNNFELRNARLEIETAQYMVKETVATGLPQVGASINYIDNIGLPVQLIPGDFFGFPGENLEVQFGTKYSSSVGATVNQLIFSGEYLVGLQASRAFLAQSRKQYFKSQIEVNKAVSEAYFLVLATIENIAVIDSTFAITSKLANQTKAIVENGFAEETELDQLLLLLSDLETSRINANNQLNISKAYLKFLIGLPLNQDFETEESLESLSSKMMAVELTERDFNFQQSIDFQLIQNQKQLALLQLKRAKSAYLPSLSGFLNINSQAQRDSWSFFDSKGRWYASSMFGVNMNIPIFSSGERRARVQQAGSKFEQSLLAEEATSTNLKIQHQNLRSELQNAYLNLQNTQKNKETAQKIFRRTGIKYSEGMAASLDLLNTQNQYLSAQSQYINAALNLLNKSIAMETLLTPGTF